MSSSDSGALVIVDDSAHEVQYNAGWDWDQNVLEFDGTRHEAPKEGLTAWLAFTGTGVQVVGTLGESAAYGQPSTAYAVDDITAGTYDAAFVTSAVMNVTFFTSLVLPFGDHTIRVTTLGGAGSGPNVFLLDYFVIDKGGVSTSDSPTQPLFPVTSSLLQMPKDARTSSTRVLTSTTTSSSSHSLPSSSSSESTSSLSSSPSSGPSSRTQSSSASALPTLRSSGSSALGLTSSGAPSNASSTVATSIALPTSASATPGTIAGGAVQVTPSPADGHQHPARLPDLTIALIALSSALGVLAVLGLVLWRRRKRREISTQFDSSQEQLVPSRSGSCRTLTTTTYGPDQFTPAPVPRANRSSGRSLHIRRPGSASGHGSVPVRRSIWTPEMEISPTLTLPSTTFQACTSPTTVQTPPPATVVQPPDAREPEVKTDVPPEADVDPSPCELGSEASEASILPSDALHRSLPAAGPPSSLSSPTTFGPPTSLSLVSEYGSPPPLPPSPPGHSLSRGPSFVDRVDGHATRVVQDVDSGLRTYHEIVLPPPYTRE